jgi:hypothetical protein
MAIKIQKTGKTYFLDPYLKEELDFDKKRIKLDWDNWWIIDGIEGSGKTTLACSLAYYVDKKFTLSNVVWTGEEFEKAVTDVPKGTAIVWDEFALVGMSRDALSNIQKIIVKKAMTIRDRNLEIFVIIPCIFELQKYFVQRARGLIHTYTPDGISRGFWRLWHYDGKDLLYENGKKRHTLYKKPRPDHSGTFTDTKGLFFDQKEYQKRKKNAVDSISHDGRRENKWKDQRDAGIVELRKCNFTQKQIGKVIGISQQRVANILTYNPQ